MTFRRFPNFGQLAKQAYQLSPDFGQLAKVTFNIFTLTIKNNFRAFQEYLSKCSQLEANLRELGTDLKPTWSTFGQLKANLKQVDANLGQLGANLNQLDANSEQLGNNVGPVWDQLGLPGED